MWKKEKKKEGVKSDIQKKVMSLNSLVERKIRMRLLNTVSLDINAVRSKGKEEER